MLRSLLFALFIVPLSAAPKLLDEQFELPESFHIYKTAGPDLTGGSYAITFDGQGRLLVGDGTAIRRLSDRDNDGVYDSSEVIATDLGWRGPQGLLVYGDRLYAVGGDGVQLFEGYLSGKALTRRGRIGAPFSTGGDHDAHTLLRGFDGYLYLMAGNGAGIENRKHITETNSPALFEREASVFRIDPDGRHWECITSGGRNPPNLGLNYLGDFFSFDSDMEWHVGLPWYRPVRLNHWIVGGDQGWQEVGAYPPYFIDCLPGILEIGRGSPTWGVFYEHNQFPAEYRESFLVCDYRWKAASNDQYSTGGRLMAFFLERAGASWKAEAKVLAKAKSNARDESGNPINFALVAAEVGPDGSLFVTDHNQGIWRIFYDRQAGTRPPPIQRAEVKTGNSRDLLTSLLTLPQPVSELTRVREVELRKELGTQESELLRIAAVDAARPVQERVRAVRLLSPNFKNLNAGFLESLARERSTEIRAMAAWLCGIREDQASLKLVSTLLDDPDIFVQRRSLEALQRRDWRDLADQIIAKLSHPDRIIRYTAMTVLTHRTTDEWLAKTAVSNDPQTNMRGLVAAHLRRDLPSQPAIRRSLRASLEDSENWTVENKLDLLRVVSLFQASVEGDPDLKEALGETLAAEFPAKDSALRWEQVRMFGALAYPPVFPKLLALLETTSDQITQFHIAQSLSHFLTGWTPEQEKRLFDWLLKNQTGWFAEFEAKGVEFPLFWSTVLADFAAHHSAHFLERLKEVDLASQLGGAVLGLVARNPESTAGLADLYKSQTKSAAKAQVLVAMKSLRNSTAANFFRSAFENEPDPKLQGLLIQGISTQATQKENLAMIFAGLRHPDPDVVRAAATALQSYEVPVDQDLARLLLSRFTERRAIAEAMDPILASAAKAGPQTFPDRGTRERRFGFWTNWYSTRFNQPFIPLTAGEEKSDEQVHALVLSYQKGQGNASNGLKTYERLQCNTCHGGGQTPGQEGRLFGPDLAGVVARLNRTELADALVYPSKQVADRFKAVEVQLKNGQSLTGFITERSSNGVTLADIQQVHRLANTEISAIKPQSSSLMPERLLNRLSDSELQDLLAFLSGPPK